VSSLKYIWPALYNFNLAWTSLVLARSGNTLLSSWEYSFPKFVLELSFNVVLVEYLFGLEYASFVDSNWWPFLCFGYEPRWRYVSRFRENCFTLLCCIWEVRVTINLLQITIAWLAAWSSWLETALTAIKVMFLFLWECKGSTKHTFICSKDCRIILLDWAILWSSWVGKCKSVSDLSRWSSVLCNFLITIQLCRLLIRFYGMHRSIAVGWLCCEGGVPRWIRRILTCFGFGPFHDFDFLIRMVFYRNRLKSLCSYFLFFNILG